MTKTTYISTGIAAVLLAFSVTGTPAFAADAETCLQKRDGFQWDTCNNKRIRMSARRVPDGPIPAVAGPNGVPIPLPDHPFPQPRGFFSTFLPDSVRIEHDVIYPGDGLGGNGGDAGGGAGGRS